MGNPYRTGPARTIASNPMRDSCSRRTRSSAILTVNCIVGGTGIALALHEADLMKATSIVIGVLAGLVIFIALASYQLRRFTRVKAAVTAAS